MRMMPITIQSLLPGTVSRMRPRLRTTPRAGATRQGGPARPCRTHGQAAATLEQLVGQGPGAWGPAGCPDGSARPGARARHVPTL